jgi:hypothetical protein
LRSAKAVACRRARAFAVRVDRQFGRLNIANLQSVEFSRPQARERRDMNQHGVPPRRRIDERRNMHSGKELLRVIIDSRLVPLGAALGRQLYAVGGVDLQPSIEHGLLEHHSHRPERVPDRGRLLARADQPVHPRLDVLAGILFSG